MYLFHVDFRRKKWMIFEKNKDERMKWKKERKTRKLRLKPSVAKSRFTACDVWQSLDFAASEIRSSNRHHSKCKRYLGHCLPVRVRHTWFSRSVPCLFE